MSLTKIGSIGINTGIQLAGVTTVSTLHVGSGVTLSSDGDIFATGISTFSEDIKVGSGITVSPDGDIFATGVCTATSFSGSGANLTGIDTDLVSDTSPQLGGNLDVNTKNIVFGDSGSASDDRLTFGAGTDLSIYHDGTSNYISSGNGNIILTKASGTEKMIRAIPDGAVELYYDNTKRLETTSTGVTITGGHTGTIIAGDFTLDNQSQAGRDVFFDQSADRFQFKDNLRASFGDDHDLMIYHDTNHSYIYDAGTGDLKIQTNGAKIQLGKDNGETSANFIPDGGVELYYDNTKRFEVTSGGINVIGSVVADGATIDGVIYAKSDADSRIVCQVSSGNSDDWNYINFVGEDGNRDGFIGTWSDGTMTIQQDGGSRMRLLPTYFEMTGHVYPTSDNANDLGSSSLRWRNLYTTDLQLSNKGKTNDVDGTWGDWTLQEGENDIFMINNRTGKKFAITMREVS